MTSLPRSWTVLGRQVEPHHDVRYTPASARATLPAFVAAIVAAFDDSGRDWIVLPAAGYRRLLDARYQYDCEGIAASMLRVMGIDLGTSGSRYVVSRTFDCWSGLPGTRRAPVRT